MWIMFKLSIQIQSESFAIFILEQGKYEYLETNRIEQSNTGLARASLLTLNACRTYSYSTAERPLSITPCI